MLRGAAVTLRAATAADVFALVTIRASPEVHRRWGGADDMAAEILDDLARPELHLLAIEEAGRVIGAIQWQSEDDPVYRHAGIDLYLDPRCTGVASAPMRSARSPATSSTTWATTGW